MKVLTINLEKFGVGQVLSRTLKVFAALCLIFLTSACNLEDQAKQDINDAFEPAPSPPLPDDDLVNSQLCESEKFIQPDAQISKKIDILFVIDTSGSLDVERGQIANGIDSFVAELPVDVDYNIAVIQGHSSLSSYTGKVYGYGSNPAVLKSSELSVSDIRSYLKTNMTKVKTDYPGDGGEENLYSLTRAITTELEYNRQKDFFRTDAALAIVFVSDENDICSLGDYPAGVTPVYDWEKKEQPAFERDCAGITPDNLVSQLRALQQNRPLLVSGIVYTGEEPVPKSGENEIGYGYLETIKKANGVTIDLASGNYDVGMREIGYLTMKKLNLVTEFPLAKREFDHGSLKVLVDRQPVEFEFLVDINEVHLTEANAGREHSEVYIEYCFPVNDEIVISNVRFGEPTSSSVVVEWNTDVDSTSQIEYTEVLTGISKLSAFDDYMTTQHGVILTGLMPNTLYDVKVISMGADGQVTMSDTYKFRTMR